jgi:hypothetical protein
MEIRRITQAEAVQDAGTGQALVSALASLARERGC